MIHVGRNESVVIEIGGLPVALRTTEPSFAQLLEQRYGDFINPNATPLFDLKVDLVPEGTLAGDDELSVRRRNGSWTVARGDFRAEWDLGLRRGWIRQSANPYGIDSLLRILHSLELSRRGGFLVHAASAIRQGRAFLFAGRSGAGKTTLARLAPREVTLLSDEISYVRRVDGGYRAYGTPFAGELARLGKNVSAPLAALYLLEKGPAVKIEPLPAAEAARALLQNILFFAENPELVERVLVAACEFVERIPVRRLTFPRDPQVWEAIG